MTVKVIAYPVAEPITIEEARQHLRVDLDNDSPPSSPDDELIMLQLAAAREWCEQYLESSIAQQTLELALDAFPLTEIQLPMGPVVWVESITYVDIDGVEQGMDEADYVLDNYSTTAWIMPAVGTTWPITQSVVNALKVRYLAGYGLPNESPPDNRLPRSIRAAILLILGSLYEQREDSSPIKQESIPLGASYLLNPYRHTMGV